MMEIGNVLKALEEARVRDRVKVLIGGAPVNAMFAKEIGADAYARTAGEAVSVAKTLLTGSATDITQRRKGKSRFTKKGEIS